VNHTTKIEISVDETTAAALLNGRCLEAVGRLVDRLVRPRVDDPLMALFERTSAEAQATGLSEEEIADELATYNTERRN
jgi:hypothetical protein